MTKKFKKGDRIVWNGDSGTFLRYSKDRKSGILKMDGDADNDIEQEDTLNWIEPLKLLTIDDIAHVSTASNLNGFVIVEDGTCYSLKEARAHGVLLALLFPEIAAKYGFKPPIKDAHDQLSKFQRMEIDHQEEMAAIRVTFGFLMYTCNLSRGKTAATAAQLDSLRAVLKSHDYGMNDTIHLNMGKRTVRKVLAELSKPEIDYTEY